MFAHFALFLVLIICGYIVGSPHLIEAIRNWLLYSKHAVLTTFGTSTIILLYKIFNLSIADFGEYKFFLTILFATTCALSFFKVRELLAVRGLGILSLFFCDYVLDGIYTKISILNNILAAIIYVMIIFGITIGSVPYILRDWMDYLFEHKSHRIVMRILLGIASIVALLAI